MLVWFNWLLEILFQDVLVIIQFLLKTVVFFLRSSAIPCPLLLLPRVYFEFSSQFRHLQLFPYMHNDYFRVIHLILILYMLILRFSTIFYVPELFFIPFDFPSVHHSNVFDIGYCPDLSYFSDPVVFGYYNI